VDGARSGTTADFWPGRSAEFVATFSGDPFQHMGFAVTYESTPWAIFSTLGGGALFARTHTGAAFIDTPVGSNWLGAPHRYRIDWSASSVTFSIDGTVVATHALAITANLRPVASDFNTGNGTLRIDWVRMTPYAASGAFTSRVFDAGEVVQWNSLSWMNQAPTGTAVTLSVHTGNTPVPDASWTSFTTIPASGGAINATSRYAQYRATLTSTDSAVTPSLDEVVLSFSPIPANNPPVAVNDSYSTDQGVTLNVAAPGVLANDTDPDNNPLTAVPGTGPSNGTLTLNSNGSFTYVPATGFHGIDSFTYLARDGTANSAPATVTVTVRPIWQTASWFSAPWFTGGSATTINGSLVVDGARAGTNAVFGPGRSMEFEATFTGDEWQHIGFGTDYNWGPWIIFSTYQGGQLYARTNTAESGTICDTPIPGNWFGTSHRYRIDWNNDNIVFSIDGTVVATHTVTIGANLRPLVSDYNPGGGSLSMKSIHY
jgi:hypothetical protein